MTKTEKGKQKSPPESYWRFDLTTVPPWQHNAWLNYEYARSCRTITDSVSAIRAGTIGVKYPCLAIDVAKDFPEFPAKAWVDIDGKARVQRLQRYGIDANYDPFGRDDSTPIEFYDIADVVGQVMAGDLCFSRSMEDEVYSVAKINFDHEDSAIVKHFTAWLTARRAKLIGQYEDQLVGTKQNPRNYFEPDPRPKQRGHGANVSQYRSWFKRLAALRLLKEMQWEDAADLTETSPMGEPLYSDDRAWRRARQEAGDLMLRFTRAWQSRSFPFLLVPRWLRGQPGLIGCTHPFIANVHKPKKDALNKYRQRIRQCMDSEVISYQELVSR